jgi:hypothetical protein
MEVVMGSIQRTLALALTLALGPTFLPLGCGGSGGGFGPAVPAQADAQVPEGVALQLRTCAARHMDHLGRAHQSVSFDVKLANDGQVDAVALRGSTLGDEELEACMASALRSLSEDDLPMLRSENLPRGPVAPESRALLGQPQWALAACLASAPCLLTLTIFAVGAYYIGVNVYVHPSTHPGTRKHHPPAVTTPPAVSAVPMPTTTAPPMPTTMPLVDQDLWRKCQQQHETYKKTDTEAADLARRTDPLEDLLHNNKASAQQHTDFCSQLAERTKVVQRLYKERSKYIELDCDKFDWFNTGTTAAERLASHQWELNKVDVYLKNLYALNKRFCQ